MLYKRRHEREGEKNSKSTLGGMYHSDMIQMSPKEERPKNLIPCPKFNFRFLLTILQTSPPMQAKTEESLATESVKEEVTVNEPIIQEKSEDTPNLTGLPDDLKAGVENLLGYSLDDVRVYYEAWHVVQQMQGRVKPTIQMKGVQINDDQGLEREADVIGIKAIQLIDNRPEILQIKMFQEMANNYSGVHPVIQLTKLNQKEQKKWEDCITKNQKSKQKIKEIMDSFSALSLPLPLNIEHSLNIIENQLQLLENSIEKAKNSVPDLSFLEISLECYQDRGDKLDKLIESTLKTAKVFLSREGRRQKYKEDRTNGLSRRGLEKDGIQKLDKDIRTPAYKDDPEKSIPGQGWTQVHDSTPAMEGDGQKFLNLYHKSAVIMLENYRDQYKTYFASDVFFDQWLRANNKKSLYDLPKEFPQYIYRNHIDNKETVEAIAQMMLEDKEVTVKENDKNWEKLKDTVNVKSTMRILDEYNKINEARGEKQYQLDKLLIYKGPTLKFTFKENKEKEEELIKLLVSESSCKIIKYTRV